MQYSKGRFEQRAALWIQSLGEISEVQLVSADWRGVSGGNQTKPFYRLTVQRVTWLL